MMDYRKKTDAFFYDNFSRAWEGTTLDRMTPIYISEMNRLLYDLELGSGYIQEFAMDYPLAQQLSIQVDGKQKAVQKPKSPYAIVPAQGIVLFQKNAETVYQCSYRKFFQILEYYIHQLQEKCFVAANGEKWEQKVKELKKTRFQTKLEKITDKLKFWDDSPGNPDVSFEGAKRLDLYPGDIASFRQLNCKDTLRSLTVNGLIKAKDLEVLSEYTNLKTLYLRQMNIKDISFLSSLVNLDELGLAGNQITDLSPLKTLKKLTHFYIADNPVHDFSVVEEMPKLRTLYTDIDQLPDQLAWDTIPNRIALRVLSLTPLENYLYHTETIYSRQVSSLVEQSGGKEKLAKQPNNTNTLNIKDRWLYSGLSQALGYHPAVKYDLTKVKSLDCSNDIVLCDDFSFLTETGDYSCLAAATKLRQLNLSGRVVNDFSWLRNCVNIKQLYLSNTDFSDLSLLSEMKQLTVLHLSGCHSITAEGFAQLRNMTKLKELHLSDTAFCDLTLLENMKNLKELYVDGCKNLTGMQGMFPHLVALRRYAFSKQEEYQFHMTAIEAFCHMAEEKGYQIHRGGTGVIPKEISKIHSWMSDLAWQPPEIVHMHHALYRFWNMFLTEIDTCISQDGNAWFLTESAYHLHAEVQYPWEKIRPLYDIIQEEYEEAEDEDFDEYFDEDFDAPYEPDNMDEAYIERQYYHKSNIYLPILAYKKNSIVTYYAIRCYDQEIVFWEDSNIMCVQSTRQTLLQFLLRIDQWVFA